MIYFRAFILSTFFLTLGIQVFLGDQPVQAQPARDTLIYNKEYRDSLNEYIGRHLAYRQRILNYDLAKGLSFFPYAGSWYVEQSGQGITYAAERLGAGAIAGIGTYRMLSSSTIRPVDIAMIVVGLGAYVYLKISEINTVQHQVSEYNEALVERFRIPVSDIDPTSIRYPKRNDYPAWVTEPPTERDHENAREAVDRPIPSFSKE